VEPDRFKLKDRAMLEYKEALNILHNTKRLQGLKDMTEKLINRYGRYRGC
jgi:hypothetical protein